MHIAQYMHKYSFWTQSSISKFILYLAGGGAEATIKFNFSYMGTKLRTYVCAIISNSNFDVTANHG